MCGCRGPEEPRKTTKQTSGGRRRAGSLHPAGAGRGQAGQPEGFRPFQQISPFGGFPDTPLGFPSFVLWLPGLLFSGAFWEGPASVWDRPGPPAGPCSLPAAP